MSEEAQPTCIYCPRADFSNEHYLPRCLGKFHGFEGLNDRVCVGCNGALGSLEANFCREGPVALFRKFYGVKGRKHHKPYDPFRGPDDERAPIEVRGSVPGEDLPARWEILPGHEAIRTFVRTGGNVSAPSDIARFVAIAMLPPGSIRSMELSTDWCGHFLAAKEDRVGYHVWAEFFVGFGGLGFACEVHLGQNPSDLIYEIRKAHRFTWFRDGKRDGYDGEMHEVELVKPFWPPVL